MSKHPFLHILDVFAPLVGMLKFCTKSTTTAMSSTSFNFCLMASIFSSKRNFGKLDSRRPVENEFSIFGIV